MKDAMTLERGEGPNIEPLWLTGKVVHGFGRGSKELGIPTANLPVVDEVAALEVGVYYGLAMVPSHDTNPRKAAISIGWNPFYKNSQKTLEVHLLHRYEQDFYGEELRVLLLGYTRPECDFASLDALIQAIHQDIIWTSEVLDRPDYAGYFSHPFFSTTTTPSLPS
jgi:riboflavin kinase